jgi:hypothetical protein
MVILLITVSRVAGITGLYRHTWQHIFLIDYHFFGIALKAVVKF